MPQFALPIASLVGGGLSAGSSAAGGKKASDAANKQLQLQQQQLQLGKDLTGLGVSKAWTPAANYWNTLLQGNPTAVQGAIGPISEQMRQQSAAGIRNLASTMPAGGERNLAVANASNQQYGDLARLYAGVQPQAASALGQLSQIPISAGVGTMGQGAPQVGAGLWAQQMGQQQAAQGMQGAGQLLYKGMQGLQNGKNSTPNSISSSSIPTGGYGLAGAFQPSGFMQTPNPAQWALY